MIEWAASNGWWCEAIWRVSNLIIWASYMLIPYAAVLKKAIPASDDFALFVVSCGIGHALMGSMHISGPTVSNAIAWATWASHIQTAAVSAWIAIKLHWASRA